MPHSSAPGSGSGVGSKLLFCYKGGVVCLSAVTQGPHLHSHNDRKLDPQMVQRGYHGTLLLNGLWGKVLSPASIIPPGEPPQDGGLKGIHVQGHTFSPQESIWSALHASSSPRASAHESLLHRGGVAVPVPSRGPLVVWIRKAGRHLAQTNDTCLGNPRRPKWGVYSSPVGWPALL